jgi:hypothetical protein
LISSSINTERTRRSGLSLAWWIANNNSQWKCTNWLKVISDVIQQGTSSAPNTLLSHAFPENRHSKIRIGTNSLCLSRVAIIPSLTWYIQHRGPSTSLISNRGKLDRQGTVLLQVRIPF